MLGARNRTGLTDVEIRRCLTAWKHLCGEDRPRPLEVVEARRHGSRTRYDDARGIVILGADVYPGTGATANSRVSMLACLALELEHLVRREMEVKRPFHAPDSYLDEAETSTAASFNPWLTPQDRADLVEDARDRLIDWLAKAA
jgi:hypothetical protein